MSAPMDGGEGAMSSCCCAKDSIVVAGISAGVMTSSAMAAIPSRDSSKLIARNSFDHGKKDFSRLYPILIQIEICFLGLWRSVSFSTGHLCYGFYLFQYRH